MSEMGANLQKNKKKNKAARRFMFVLFLILLLMISGIISYSYVVNSGNDVSSTALPVIAQDDEIRFDVPLGSSTESIANKLEAEGIINFPIVFRYLSKLNGFDGQYRSGTHLIGKNFSYNDLMRALSNQPDSEKVLLKEGITAK
ncbi:MAG TPA: endolytic transglycosylase MltG, partial [Clostridia bacterium]